MRVRNEAAGVYFNLVGRLSIPSRAHLWLSPGSTKMAGGIGEKLRLAREARGIALRDISEQTRISMRYLEAIETDNYRRLPGGIFNRSFIRAYAKFVGYDEDLAIEEYSRMVREHGESPDQVATKPFRSLVYTDEGGGTHNRSPLWTLLLALIILVLLSIGVWLGLYFYQRSVASKNQTGQGLTPIKHFGVNAGTLSHGPSQLHAWI